MSLSFIVLYVLCLRIFFIQSSVQPVFIKHLTQVTHSTECYFAHLVFFTDVHIFSLLLEHKLPKDWNYAIIPFKVVLEIPKCELKKWVNSC